MGQVLEEAALCRPRQSNLNLPRRSPSELTGTRVQQLANMARRSREDSMFGTTCGRYAIMSCAALACWAVVAEA